MDRCDSSSRMAVMLLDCISQPCPVACAQALLWFGIKRSKRAPTKMHPYGYMRDKFVFSLISAVGIFCLGAGVSVWNGVSGLLAATPVEHVGWSIAGTRPLLTLDKKMFKSDRTTEQN